jgi:hypothetical protein
MPLGWMILLAIIGASIYIGACVSEAASSVVIALTKLGEKLDALNDRADLIAIKADEIEDCVSGRRQAYVDKVNQRFLESQV